MFPFVSGLCKRNPWQVDAGCAAWLRVEGGSRNFVEELLFEVDVNVNVLFRMVCAERVPPGKCFSCRSYCTFRSILFRCTRRNFVDWPRNTENLWVISQKIQMFFLAKCVSRKRSCPYTGIFNSLRKFFPRTRESRETWHIAITSVIS